MFIFIVLVRAYMFVVSVCPSMGQAARHHAGCISFEPTGFKLWLFGRSTQNTLRIPFLHTSPPHLSSSTPNEQINTTTNRVVALPPHWVSSQAGVWG